MKKVICLLLLTVCFGVSAQAQATEIIQLGLNIEKLAQLRSILSNLKRGYDIVSRGYNTVKNIGEGNFKLHQVFLDGLYEVSPFVRKYYKVTEIVESQIALVRAYGGAYRRFFESGHFTPEELAYIARVYEDLGRASLKNLDELVMVITAGKLRMSDHERLQSIDRIHGDVTEKLRFLRHFNGEASILALQRAREAWDVKKIGSWHNKSDMK